MRWASFLLAVGLASLGCSEDEARPVELSTPRFSYELYLDEENSDAFLLLTRRPDHLEHVYARRGKDEQAKTLFGHLEGGFHQTGIEFANRTALACALDLPIRCTPDWEFLDESLGRSDGPGAQRLKQVLANSFSAQARQRGVETQVVLATVNALLAGGTARAAVGKATVTAEARAAAGAVPRAPARGAAVSRAGAMEARAAAAGAERLSVATGRLRAPADVSAMATRMVEAEALEVGKRQTGVVADLARLRPSAKRPPSNVAADDALWGDYVTYWERRFVELSGPGVRPPLTWEGYRTFRLRFSQAMAFQREVSSVLQREAELSQGERQWLQGMEQPALEENVGLAHEDSASRTYVDQLVVDEATLKHDAPRVETFSTKQRDFTRMEETPLGNQVRADAREALGKYGGTVEVRRPGHPLFERRVSVSKVHLVYDKRLLPLNQDFWKVMDTAARRVGVELHFLGP